MQLDALGGLLGLALVFLVVILIVSLVLAIGAIAVALVSLPLLTVLPTVRSGFLSAATSLSGTPADSVTEPWPLAVYVVGVDSYGLAVLLVVVIAVNGIGLFEPSSSPDVGAVLYGLLIAATLAVVVIVAGLRLLSLGRIRALGEWAVFLVVVAALTLVASFVVPAALFGLLTHFL
ncbi:hypothetical protein [Halobaculum rarum]|uniref:hypothetical protein n=1 Tax=Halobaculum rarum TaxID=3075122 RepID=UPI0032AF38F2